MSRLRDVPRPPTGKTPVRNFRIPAVLYGLASAIAEKRGETVTDVVIRALEAYVKRHRRELEQPPAE